MAKKRATPEVAHEHARNDRSTLDTNASDKLSLVFGRQAELPPSPEQDRRLVEFLVSHGSIPKLSVGLNKFKNRKYKLLTRFPDLQQLADVHPQRHALAALNRKIRLYQEAINLLTTQPAMTGVAEPTSRGAGTDAAPTSRPKGRKRGPKPDRETAAQVAEIVARAAPDGNWQENLDAVCESLDDANIPIPKTWRADGTCRSWSAKLEAPIVRKAIAYRLKMARPVSTKPSSETLA
jgi:hypothetical protein